MEALNLLGTLFGLGFTSGLNLYATVLTVGLAINLHLIHLPERMQSLAALGTPLVLLVAGLLFVIEFIADKIPWVDSTWDSVHTAIRPIGATVLGGYALMGSDPATQTALALLCGGVALTSHTTKAATRVMANTSPEPVSNVLLSLLEDFCVVVGVGLTFLTPLITLALVVLFVLVVLWISPKLYRLLRGGAGKVRGIFGRRSGDAAL